MFSSFNSSTSYSSFNNIRVDLVSRTDIKMESDWTLVHSVRWLYCIAVVGTFVVNIDKHN